MGRTREAGLLLLVTRKGVFTWAMFCLSDLTHSIVVKRVIFFQTELMVEICSDSLVRAIGKVLLLEFSLNTN